MDKTSIKLLIVDDEDNVRSGIAAFIEARSKLIEKIYQSSNGRDALADIVKYKPDLMLIDVQMPYKDGLTVMKEALEAGYCPRTIILSGYDEFKYAQLAIRYGAVDYCLKPCRPTEILSKLDKLATEVIEENSKFPTSQTEVEKAGVKFSNCFVQLAAEHINENFSENLTLTSVAKIVGVTPAYLSTLFTQSLGCGFIDYLNKVRVDGACDLLYNRQIKMYEVAYHVGFKDEKYFSKVFKKLTGLSPSEFRKLNVQRIKN